MCSLPPSYQSTRFQYFIAFISAKHLSFLASINLKKYQLDPAHCGITSVSLFASLPQFGHLQFTNSLILANGLSPLSVGSYSFTSGKTIGRFSSFSGTHPQVSQ